jgi:hypothetical protein
MTLLRTALLGCAAVAATAIAGGCGSDDEPSQRSSTAPAATVTESPPPARTATTPRSKSGAGTRRTTTTPSPSKQPRARSPKASTRTTTAPSKPTPTRRAKLGTPQTFRGDGDRVIGRLSLERNAVVRWTVAGDGRFTVRDAAGRLKISGRGKIGQSFAASGDYTAVKVSADGRWTLSFTPLG